MRVVVTGATGNVGSALLRALAGRTDIEVVGLARRTPTATTHDRLSWVEADLTDDACRPMLREAFTGADAVVHLAWGFQPSHRPDRLRELGVGGTGRVLDAAAETTVPHLVHMSSVGAYSPKVDDLLVDEGHPTGGIPGSMYSRHKSEVERLLDRHEAGVDAVPAVARLRPGIVGQRAAGSALLRYGLPGIVPARALALLALLPLLPIDRRLRLPMVHADDVADAVVRVLDRRATGAFNLAAEPVLTPEHLGRALRAKPVHLPGAVLRTGVDLSWRAHLQPLDPGWIELAMRVPLLDTRRARDELGWTPTRTADDTLAETVAGMRDSDSGPSAILRPRSVVGALRDRVVRGAVSSRSRP